MGVVPPRPGFPAGAAGGVRRGRGPAVVRRGHHRLPGRPWRCQRVVRRPARRVVLRQGDRRRPCRRCLWRFPREVMASIAPLGGVYQGGTLSGNPLATAAGLASCASSTTRPTLSSNAPPPDWPTGLERGLRRGRRGRRSCRGSVRSSGIFFTDVAPTNFDEAQAAADNGVYNTSSTACSSAASPSPPDPTRRSSCPPCTPTSSSTKQSPPRPRLPLGSDAPLRSGRRSSDMDARTTQRLLRRRVPLVPRS